MAVMKSMTEPVLSPWRGSLFLVKRQISTIHDSDGVYDRASLYLNVVVVCF